MHPRHLALLNFFSAAPRCAVSSGGVCDQHVRGAKACTKVVLEYAVRLHGRPGLTAYGPQVQIAITPINRAPTPNARTLQRAWSALPRSGASGASISSCSTASE